MSDKTQHRNKQFKPEASAQTMNLMNKDIWDDKILIKAYDASLKLAQGEVAKRIARSTNTNNSAGDSEDICSDEDIKQEINDSINLGDYVRATYEDGVDYEARVISLDDDGVHCLLRYIGYENEQTVEIDKLLPSWGKRARKRQKQMVVKEAAKEGRGGAFGLCGPPPPPPMPPMLADGSEESEQLSAMLMAWYMSGYYTGVYQGRRMAESDNRQ